MQSKFHLAYYTGLAVTLWIRLLWNLSINGGWLFQALQKADTYSVMQSDGNSFCGDVVLDSFNMVNSDEDSI